MTWGQPSFGSPSGAVMGCCPLWQGSELCSQARPLRGVSPCLGGPAQTSPSPLPLRCSPHRSMLKAPWIMSSPKSATTWMPSSSSPRAPSPAEPRPTPVLPEAVLAWAQRLHPARLEHRQRKPLYPVFMDSQALKEFPRTFGLIPFSLLSLELIHMGWPLLVPHPPGLPRAPQPTLASCLPPSTTGRPRALPHPGPGESGGPG